MIPRGVSKSGRVIHDRHPRLRKRERFRRHISERGKFCVGQSLRSRSGIIDPRRTLGPCLPVGSPRIVDNMPPPILRPLDRLLIHRAGNAKSEGSLLRIPNNDRIDRCGDLHLQIDKANLRIRNQTETIGSDIGQDRFRRIFSNPVVFCHENRVFALFFQPNRLAGTNGSSFAERPKIGPVDLSVRKPERTVMRMILLFGDFARDGVAVDIRFFRVCFGGRVDLLNHRQRPGKERSGGGTDRPENRRSFAVGTVFGEKRAVGVECHTLVGVRAKGDLSAFVGRAIIRPRQNKERRRYHRPQKNSKQIVFPRTSPEVRHYLSPPLFRHKEPPRKVFGRNRYRSIDVKTTGRAP